jgi:sporulation protein YlmC with PRC-barrel domain
MMRTTGISGAATNNIHALRDLVDRQIIDCNERMVGKVDDLELTLPDDGPPVVTAVLVGGAALARRFGGRFGQWVERVAKRIATEPVPSRVPMELIGRVEQRVEVTCSRQDLGVMDVEKWLRDHVITPIPGGGNATD